MFQPGGPVMCTPDLRKFYLASHIIQALIIAHRAQLSGSWEMRGPPGLRMDRDDGLRGRENSARARFTLPAVSRQGTMPRGTTVAFTLSPTELGLCGSSIHQTPGSVMGTSLFESSRRPPSSLKFA